MNSASWIEPPPPRQNAMGCFGKGCLILVVFFAVLGIAFVGGGIYAVHHLRTTFFTRESMPLPQARSTVEERQLAWARWRIFERRARAHEPASIELTANDLNALIAAQPKLRGKAFVSIENNTLQLQTSFPLDDVQLLRGYYVNGECTIHSASSGDPDAAQITNIVLNGHPVDDAALTWRYPWSLRGFISKWVNENDLKTFEIRDDKVILETKGSG